MSRKGSGTWESCTNNPLSVNHTLGMSAWAGYKIEKTEKYTADVCYKMQCAAETVVDPAIWYAGIPPTKEEVGEGGEDWGPRG